MFAHCGSRLQDASGGVLRPAYGVAWQFREIRAIEDASLLFAVVEIELHMEEGAVCPLDFAAELEEGKR
jgi:hypothetical protein